MSRPKKRLDWSETAWREFIDGIAFIAEDSPHGASLVKARIDRAAGFVHSHPRMGKPGAVAGTREYPVPRTRYMLIYEEGAAVIYILHCWHQSRNRAADRQTKRKVHIDWMAEQLGTRNNSGQTTVSAQQAVRFKTWTGACYHSTHPASHHKGRGRVLTGLKLLPTV